MATERTVLVRLKADVSDFVAGMGLASAAVRGLNRDIDRANGETTGSFERTSRAARQLGDDIDDIDSSSNFTRTRSALRGLTDDINTSNERTAWLVQGFLALAPALVPLGAAATPILSGIVTQMTVAGAAAGVLALGLVGIGDALGAVNAYQLDPTAASLEKMRVEVQKLGPDGAEFVLFLDSIGSKLNELRLIAREGMLPGFTEGIEDAMTMLPEFGRIIGQISIGLGQLGREAGAGISGPGFEDFFNFLETDARPILLDMGRTLGNFIEGLGGMIVAFAPMSRDFSTGFLQMSRDFAEWSHGLEDNQGFQDFVAYVEQSVPKALDFLSSLGDAFLQIVEAASAVGDVLLPVFSAFFDVVAMIADTPIGSVFIALAAGVAILGRTMAFASLAAGGMSKAILGLASAYGIQGAALKANMALMMQYGAMTRAQIVQQQQARAAVVRSVASMGALAAGIALLSTGTADAMGVQNAVLGATIGLIAGPWGAAVGFAIGSVKDFADANDDAQAAIDGLNKAMETGAGPTALSEQLATANAEMDEFAEKQEITRSEDFWSKLTFGATEFGNQLAVANDYFTGTQDELAATAVEAQGLLEAWVQLGLVMGIPVKGTDDLENLELTASRAQPAMDALGVSIQQVAAMSASEKIDFGDQIREFYEQADTAASRTGAVVDALSDLEGVTIDTAAAVDALKSAMDDLFGVEIDQQEALDNWYASLKSMREAIRETNGEILVSRTRCGKSGRNQRDSCRRCWTRHWPTPGLLVQVRPVGARPCCRAGRR